MIHLSKSASKEIRRLQGKSAGQEPRVRLSIAPGGCAGLYYNLGFAGTVEVGDRFYDCEGISVILDAQSLAHVQGMTLDYSEDLMGGGFRFHNPQAINVCSCGNSFSIQENG
ncbi:MAG: iron-sulfur cluster assembly accessory protein [Coleofasciculaceae cyanobacterium SM2_1_6]|nr:iron-sulfur cluster assembly accessory protein [Coleofasciculaceae cyanobacterium SM2_1_6]